MVRPLLSHQPPPTNPLPSSSNEFSIILGHPNLAGIITKNYLFIYMLNVTNLFIYNPILSTNTTALPVREIKSALNCNGNQWKSISSVLPWTIDFHGGNACNENAYNGPYDNTWINYAGEHVDVPTDKRCKWMDFVGFRCVLDRGKPGEGWGIGGEVHGDGMGRR